MIRVVGVGSHQGDDRAGWAAIELLRAVNVDAELHSVEGGQRLLELLDGQGTLILLDAVASGCEPGTIHRLEWPDERLQALSPGTSHDMRPGEALLLAKTLGLLPERVVLVGVEGVSWQPGAELGSAVRAALPRLVECVMEEVDRARCLSHA